LSIDDKVIESLSKKLNLPKETLRKLFDYFEKNKLLWASLNEPWRYPAMGDDQKSCPMLDAMFHIEHNKGIIIFIPYHKEEIRE